MRAVADLRFCFRSQSGFNALQFRNHTKRQTLAFVLNGRFLGTIVLASDPGIMIARYTILCLITPMGLANANACEHHQPLCMLQASTQAG